MSHGAGRSGEEDAESRPMAGSYVVARLRELDKALAAAVPRVQGPRSALREPPRQGASPRRKEVVHDEEAIHDLRVAIRRMRTLLKMSRELFGRWHTDVVREAFAQVMRATGELRDEEVLEETLEGAAKGPEYEGWLGHRKVREGKLRRNVIARIERGDLDRARLMLKALLVFPVEPTRNVELARFARRTVERARRKVERRRDAAVTDATAMHELRIAYKELRYSIELLADALPIDARAQLEPATVFQKRLGELHDVDVATDVVQKAKALGAGAREEALASLAALRAKRVAKYLRELDPLGAGAAPLPAAGALPPRNGQHRPRAHGSAGEREHGERSPGRDREPIAADGAAGMDDAPTVYIRDLGLKPPPERG